MTGSILNNARTLLRRPEVIWPYARWLSARTLLGGIALVAGVAGLWFGHRARRGSRSESAD